MYKSKWPVFSDEMIQNVSNVLKSGKVNQWTGNKVFDFEKKFCKYFNVKHSVAVFNGSVAIALCLKTLGLKVGDEVIVTARTFIASASEINMCGCTPIFADVDYTSQNITLETIRKVVTINTKAVILVHLAGWPCDVEEIVDWCHANNIYVIEDCAQSHGAKYNERYLGTFGDINAWSFCQDKIITTGGEGGMVTTNNTQLYLKAWSFKDHGKNYDKIFNQIPVQPPNPGMFRWVHDSLGTNWRMTEMQASIGLDALDNLEEWINIRRHNAQIFNNTFENLPIVRLTIPSKKCYHAYYKYYCFVRPQYLKDGITRNDLIAKINEMGIPCLQGTCGEVYKEKAYSLDLNLTITKELSETSLMLLVDPTFNSATINEIAQKIRALLIDLSI
jgi:hypothetical protein